MYKNSIYKLPHFYVGLLCLVFLCGECIINPIGNFPLNDEWLYAKMVFNYQQQHSFNGSRWGYTSMLAHLIYGNLSVSLFGSSYTVLHFSTLVLSLLGVISFFYLLNDFVLKNSYHSFLLSLVLLVNPLYVSLSNSFMTDVPFISTSITALYFFLKYNSTNKPVFLILCCLFFMWSVLIRQLGVAFIGGVIVTQLVINKNKIVPSIIILTTSIVCLFVFEFWLKHKGFVNGYSYLFFKSETILKNEPINYVAINFLKRWVHYISFSGFVLFPILLPKFISFIKEKKFQQSKKTIAISVLLFLPVVWSMQKFPIGNYFYNTGVGAETLYDTYLKSTNTAHSFSYLFYVIKAISYIGSLSLIHLLVHYAFRIWNSRHQKEQNFAQLLLVISLFFYYTLLAFSNPIFDRYIIVFSILIIPIISFDNTALFKKSVIICTTLMFSFAVFASKDYFSGHRTRWQAIHFLKQNYKITDEQINGGLEHESSVFFESKDWFQKWNNEPKNDYLISYGNMQGYTKFTWFTFQRYIPYKKDTVFVLKKKDVY
jgi:hypothetical protein